MGDRHSVPGAKFSSRRHDIVCWQVLTQEDWNIVLFAGMELTSHWAGLYFVALMTFGNYVLFNLLVAILVEGFSNQVTADTGVAFVHNKLPPLRSLKSTKC